MAGLTDERTSACLTLAAIVLVWIGTASITLVGIPSLLPEFLEDGKGQVLEDSAGNILSTVDPQSAKDHVKYLKWALFGMGLITAGMALQAFEPVMVIRRSSV